MAADGAFVVAWSSLAQDGSDWAVYAQRFNAAGAPQGPEFRVNTTTAFSQWSPSVAMDADGNFVIAWESGLVSYYGLSDTDIYAQRYNALALLALLALSLS